MALRHKVEVRFGKVKHKDGNVVPFLGMKIMKGPDGSLSVDQPVYVSDLVADMFEEHHVSSPSHKDLLSRGGVGNKLLDPKDFGSRVAKVMYLATKTRPDLLFTVSTLASRASEPYEADVKSLNHLYDYINSNQTVPLKFQCNDMVLSASVDASHDIHRDSKGHSGLVVSLEVFQFSIDRQNRSLSLLQQCKLKSLLSLTHFITSLGSGISWRNGDTSSLVRLQFSRIIRVRCRYSMDLGKLTLARHDIIKTRLHS
jgi:hypothetical protein